MSDINVTLRIPEELKAVLEAAAKAQERSLTNYIRRILVAYINEEKAKVTK